jgi:hypothetical protein
MTNSIQVSIHVTEDPVVIVKLDIKQLSYSVPISLTLCIPGLLRPYTIKSTVNSPFADIPPLYHDPLTPLTPLTTLKHEPKLLHLLDAVWGFALSGDPSLVCTINMFEIEQNTLLYLREQLSMNSLLIFTPNVLSVVTEKDTIYAVKLVLLFDQNVILFHIYPTTVETLKRQLKAFITSPEGSITLVDGKLTLPINNIISSRRNNRTTRKKRNEFGLIFPELGPLCAALDDDTYAWDPINPGQLFYNPYFNAAIKEIHENVVSFCTYLRHIAATFSYPLIVQLDMDNNLLQTNEDAANGFTKRQTNEQRWTNDTRYRHMTPDAASPEHFKVHFNINGYMTIRNEKNAQNNYTLHETYSHDVMVCYCSELILRTCYEIGAKVFIHTWADITYARDMVRHANLRGWKSEEGVRGRNMTEAFED